MTPNRFKFRAWDDVKRMMLTVYEPMKWKFPMQSTGLIDKNGKEIFEGDVILGKFILNDVEDYLFLRLTESEKNSQSKIFIIKDIFYMYTNPVPEDVEIIGNIYENPELLTK